MDCRIAGIRVGRIGNAPFHAVELDGRLPLSRIVALRPCAQSGLVVLSGRASDCMAHPGHLVLCGRNTFVPFQNPADRCVWHCLVCPIANACHESGVLVATHAGLCANRSCSNVAHGDAGHPQSASGHSLVFDRRSICRFFHCLDVPGIESFLQSETVPFVDSGCHRHIRWRLLVPYVDSNALLRKCR